MRIALLEFICGSDCIAEHFQVTTSPESRSSLVDEGFGMLASLALDLTACGHKVQTILSAPALAVLGAKASNCLEACSVSQLSQATSWEQQWQQLAKSCDLTLLIAPDDVLARIVKAFEINRIRTWNASSPFIALTADKLKTARWITRSNAGHQISQQGAGRRILHPKTCLLEDLLQLAEAGRDLYFEQSEMPCPSNGFILKDRFGVGCLGAEFYPSLDQALKIYTEHSSIHLGNEEQCRIIQPWYDGVSLGLSCVLSEDGRLEFLGAMVQKIEFQARREQPEAEQGTAIGYMGGRGPVLSDQAPFFKEWCTDLLRHFPGGRGWVGIDVVVQGATENDLSTIGTEQLQESLLFIEINPRLTSSYIGFRVFYGPELSELCLGLKSHQQLPSVLHTRKPVDFSVI